VVSSWFDCDESLTWRCLNSNPGHFGCFTFILVSLKNRVCLSRDVQVAGASWRAVMMTVTGVGDLVQRTGDDRTSWVLGDRAIPKRSGDAVCGLHRACGDEKHEFLG
jgi:hypothetical protein